MLITHFGQKFKNPPPKCPSRASLILVLCFRNFREGHHQMFQLPTSCFMSGCAESIQTLIFYHHTLFRTNCKKPKQNKSYSVTRPRWHHRYFVMMKSSENNLQKRQTPLPPPPGHPTIVWGIQKQACFPDILQIQLGKGLAQCLANTPTLLQSYYILLEPSPLGSFHYLWT